MCTCAVHMHPKPSTSPNSLLRTCCRRTSLMQYLSAAPLVATRQTLRSNLLRAQPGERLPTHNILRQVHIYPPNTPSPLKSSDHATTKSSSSSDNQRIRECPRMVRGLADSLTRPMLTSGVPKGRWPPMAPLAAYWRKQTGPQPAETQPVSAKTGLATPRNNANHDLQLLFLRQRVSFQQPLPL